jgi:hypothetical protein
MLAITATMRGPGLLNMRNGRAATNPSRAPDNVPAETNSPPTRVFLCPLTEGTRVSATERPQGDHSVWTAARLATPRSRMSEVSMTDLGIGG